MKLDVTCMRYLSKDDYRVLTAVEMGMKNHDVVPVELIVNIAKLRHGGAQKFLTTLLRFKLIYNDKTTYDGTCSITLEASWSGCDWGVGLLRFDWVGFTASIVISSDPLSSSLLLFPHAHDRLPAHVRRVRHPGAQDIAGQGTHCGGKCL